MRRVLKIEFKYEESRMKSRSLLILLVCSFSGLSFAEIVWIDVRSAPEHFIDHIDGDIRISYSDVAEKIPQLYPDKDTEIHFYCRAGVRAGKALEQLKQAGYANVFNAGSIGDARQQRGLSD